jgi:hypothetical protein
VHKDTLPLLMRWVDILVSREKDIHRAFNTEEDSFDKVARTLQKRSGLKMVAGLRGWSLRRRCS